MRRLLCLALLSACTEQPSLEQVQARVDAELRRGLVMAVEAALAKSADNRVPLRLDNDERFRHFISDEVRAHEVNTFLRRMHLRVSLKGLDAIDLALSDDSVTLALHYGPGLLQVTDDGGRDSSALLRGGADLWKRAWAIAEPGITRALAPLTEQVRVDMLEGMEALPIRWERRLAEHDGLRRAALSADWGLRHDQALEQLYLEGRLVLIKAEVLRAFGDPGGRHAEMFLSGPLSGLVLTSPEGTRAELDGPEGIVARFLARGQLPGGLLEDTMASVRPYDHGPGGGRALEAELKGVTDPLRICLMRVSIFHQAPGTATARALLSALESVTRAPVPRAAIAGWVKSAVPTSP